MQPVQIEDTLKTEARKKARDIFSQSSSFLSLPKEEQLSIYKDIVDAEYDKLAQQKGLVKGMATESASDKIPDKATYQNDRIDNAGRMMGDFVKEVDFTGFVADLLKGVFDANLDVTLRQMEAYQELLKSATSSLSSFIKEISDVDTFSHLADNSNGDFKFHMGGDGDVSQGTVVLTDKDGNPVDTEDTKIKSMVMSSQIALAKERRALLRETILMGVSRLVVEKGTVKAGVIFDFHADETIGRSDQANVTDTQTSIKTKGGGGGFSIFGLGGASGSKKKTDIRRKTAISVASASSTNNSELAAKLTGNVEIIFRSDYFKLDNFAKMYGDISDEEKEEAEQ